MTYARLKAANADTRRCVAYNCKRNCTDDCLLCPQCQDEHRERNRAWWAKKYGNRVQMKLPLDLSSVGHRKDV